ncbi:hypothetical protein BGX26_008781, partial [Mortierella sp. AD094]
MPTTEKLDDKKAQEPAQLPSPKSTPQREQTPPSSSDDSKAIENGSLEKDAIAKKSNIIQDIKKRIPGAFPAMPRIGWLDAYKRIDGPTN